jgi:nucleoside-diphosphate-sugar epimerase
MTVNMRINKPSGGRNARRILVTGGAGFIGSHLCDSLLQRGDTVICADNLLTGRLRNIRPLLNHPGFTFVEHDVRNPIGPRACYDEGKRGRDLDLRLSSCSRPRDQGRPHLQHLRATHARK